MLANTLPKDIGGPKQAGVAHLVGKYKGVFLWKMNEAQQMWESQTAHSALCKNSDVTEWETLWKHECNYLNMKLNICSVKLAINVAKS